MKKIMLPVLSIVLLASCGDKKNEDKKTDTAVTATETKESAATGNDAALVQWLSGKMLVSKNSDPSTDMWNNLKLNADGTCTDKDNASAKWTVKDGKFIFESAMTLSKEIEKKDDTTLVFKGEISDQTYILRSL